MDKKEVDGTLRFYLKMLWMPLLALIAIDVIAFMTMRLNLLGIKSYAYSLFFGLLISCLIAWYIGYITVKKYSNNFMTSAVTGAAAGAISGLVMGTSVTTWNNENFVSRRIYPINTITDNCCNSWRSDCSSGWDLGDWLL
jgi:uncharacterized membrane protein (DUF485 family)